MAEPIQFVYRPQDHPEARRVQMQRELENAPVEHYAALLELYSTLEAAHQNHVLEILRGAMTASGHITAELAAAFRSEASIRGLRNLIMLTEMLGSLDPEALHRVVRALPVAISKAGAQARVSKPPSLWGLFRSLTSVEARRALGVGAAVLIAFGGAMGAARKHK